MTTFTISIENNSQAVTFEQTLQMMGLKYVRFDLGAEAEAPQVARIEAPQAETDPEVVEIVDELMAELDLEEAPKKDTKKPAPKKGGKKGSKSDDDFDRELYIELGEHFGVRTKGGVARFARNTIYDAMSEVEKSRGHKLTKKAESALWKQLMAEAVKFGEQWAIDMVQAGFAKVKAN